MAMLTLRCPSCYGKFSVKLDAQPRYCPLCGYDTAEDEAKKDARLAAMLETQTPPHYQNAPLVTAVDHTYNSTVAASEFNMHKAAELAGVDVSEMSGMKVTNMRDDARYGEDAAAKLDNPVTQMMAASPNNTGFQRDPQIESYRAGAMSGPAAGSGLGTMKNIIQSGHHGRRDAVVANGTKFDP